MDKVMTVFYNTNRWHRGLLIFLIIEMKVLPAGQRGFTCNDPALSHTFNGDTITWKHLFGTTLLLPLAVMLVVERICHKNEGLIPKKQALRWYKEYMFGFLLNLIVVQGLKLIVGSPRPHFFDTCSPNEATTCQDSEYIPRYTCSKTERWTSESGKSFPSGHTALAAHAGIFIAYYLYRRASRSRVVYLTQAVLLLSTVYCGISRMIDHRHHWWDVLGGATIALPILLYTIFYLCRNFEATISKETVYSSETTSNLDVNISNNIPLIEKKEPLDA